MSTLTLAERIRRGEEAIAKAKANGRDVKSWEEYLQSLKQLAGDTTTTVDDVEALYSLADIRFLQGKADEHLQFAHRVKVVFGGGRIVQ